MPKKQPAENSWRYKLPCAYFDGPNEAIAEMQGWRKTSSLDAVAYLAVSGHLGASQVKIWNMAAVGSSTPDEKWAIERRFTDEDSDMSVATYDVFDKGIIFMFWWLGNDTDDHGFALKTADGKWRVMQKDEWFSVDFDHKEIPGETRTAKLTRFEIAIHNRGKKESVAKAVVVRE